MIPYFCSFVVAALESVITDILHQATFVVVPIDEVLLLPRGCVRPWDDSVNGVIGSVGVVLGLVCPFLFEGLGRKLCRLRLHFEHVAS